MSFLTFSIDIADKNANATYLTVVLASGTIAVTDTDAGIDNNFMKTMIMKKNIDYDNTADFYSNIIATAIIAMIISVMRHYWKGQMSSRTKELTAAQAFSRECIERQTIRSDSHVTRRQQRASRISDEGEIRGTGAQALSHLRRRKYSPLQDPAHGPSAAFLALDAPPRSSPGCFELSTRPGSLRCRVLNCPLTCYSIHVQHISP